MLARGEALVKPNYVAKFVDRPVACFHGTTDYINAYRGTAEFMDLLKVSDKTFYSYPEYYHDLFHERKERSEKVLTDTFEWLNKHTEAGTITEAKELESEAVAAASKVNIEGPEN